MASAPATSWLRTPVAFGNTTFAQGQMPRGVMVLSDPWHRRTQACAASAAGVIAALADTGVNASGVNMTFAKIIRP